MAAIASDLFIYCLFIDQRLLFHRYIATNAPIGEDLPELLKYKVERNAPLPTGKPMDKLAEEEEEEQQQ